MLRRSLLFRNPENEEIIIMKEMEISKIGGV